ncbi:MAG: phosphopentomutase [Actinobacteria bacterium]|nr:phosphopentomutase [Actinomycetota bacterium]
MRSIVLVIDGFGIGALPDAAKYGDEGANTILHLCELFPEKKWSNLKELGLGNCFNVVNPKNLPGCEAIACPKASFGAMAEASPGRDTTTGHWEIAGIILDKAFPLFPTEYPSFPEDLVSKFEQRTGTKIIGNKAASGTEIIEELGEIHMQTGYPICYTAHDSIFQIAAHEEIIAIEKLYKMCEIARELCNKYNIPRVIARPFLGSPGNFYRTERRRDFSIALSGKSVLEVLQENGVQVIGIGKIGDLFNEVGLDRSYHDSGNIACMSRLLEILNEDTEKNQFIFINLVETDMLFGHRRDPKGFLDAVSVIDLWIPKIIGSLNSEDLLIITADHGCDPVYKGTDHTREYVPLVSYKKENIVKELGIRKQFSDIAVSVISFFGIGEKMFGQKFN